MCVRSLKAVSRVCCVCSMGGLLGVGDVFSVVQRGLSVVNACPEEIRAVFVAYALCVR